MLQYRHIKNLNNLLPFSCLFLSFWKAGSQAAFALVMCVPNSHFTVLVHIHIRGEKKKERINKCVFFCGGRLILRFGSLVIIGW